MMKCDTIKCYLNIRDGLFGATLRKRKGLNPVDFVYLSRKDNLATFIEKIKASLPVGFTWDPVDQPPRYQRIKEQPQTSLQPLTEDMNFFQLFIPIISRKSALRNMDPVIDLWVYGSWNPPQGKSENSERWLFDHNERPLKMIKTDSSVHSHDRSSRSGVEVNQLSPKNLSGAAAQIEEVTKNECDNENVMASTSFQENELGAKPYPTQELGGWDTGPMREQSTREFDSVSKTPNPYEKRSSRDMHVTLTIPELLPSLHSCIHVVNRPHVPSSITLNGVEIPCLLDHQTLYSALTRSKSSQ
jgi:hypothetical protein